MALDIDTSHGNSSPHFLKPARRLLAHIIYEFQRGAVRTEDAKTLAYLLIKYSELYKVETLAEIDERLIRLEEINATA